MWNFGNLGIGDSVPMTLGHLVALMVVMVIKICCKNSLYYIWLYSPVCSLMSPFQWIAVAMHCSSDLCVGVTIPLLKNQHGHHLTVIFYFRHIMSVQFNFSSKTIFLFKFYFNFKNNLLQFPNDFH